MMATMIAIRTDGNADGEPPTKPVAMRSVRPKPSWATTSSPRARAVPHARTPATTRSRARRSRPATSAATTTRPSAHRAPSRYRARNSGASPFGNVLKRSKTARSLRVTSPWWNELTTRIAIPRSRPNQSRVRRRNAPSAAGRNMRTRHERAGCTSAGSRVVTTGTWCPHRGWA